MLEALLNSGISSALFSCYVFFCAVKILSESNLVMLWPWNWLADDSIKFCQYNDYNISSVR